MHRTDGDFGSWRNRVYHIIFEADTPAGKLFDVLLLWSILISIGLVMLDSVAGIHLRFGAALYAAEWVFTALFTAEYLIRLITVPRPLRYARSFFGVVDLLAIVPTYLSLMLTGTQALLVVRALRLLRVFRVLKLGRYLREATVLRLAVRASLPKISVFLYTVLTLVVIIGTLMYVIEGPQRGFTSIPTSIYWAIVTLTTVGYGDISPVTPAGRVLASMAMILGYGIIAVPTGIVTVEMARFGAGDGVSTRVCDECAREGHDMDASHCKYCGSALTANDEARLV
ncbi:ion transporter [Immundisolibacter sp.]|uniref:ion transporter n=1 Tax=Immundisolibacter sp. TaxID=1934948 RepID=UPI0035695C08